MIGELEARVGYLFVVGGRAVSAMPPGALIEPPPKKAPRGRETDTFFTLLTPAGTEQAQASFYEQTARLAATHYFGSSGSVTSGLREALTGVNSQLLNAVGAHYQVNALCLVLRGRDVYVARSGATLTLLRQGDTFSSSPEDLRDEYALNGLPLGYSPSPDIKLAHYEIAPGHVIALCDSGLAAADRTKLDSALAQSDLAATLDALKPLAAPRTQAMIIHFGIIAAPLNIPLSSTSALPIAPPPVAAVNAANLAPIPAAPIPTPTVSVPALPLAVSTPIATPLNPPPTAAPAEKIRPKARGLQIITRPIIGLITFILRGIARLLNGLLNWLLPEPEDGRSHIPAAVAAGAAILIPVLVVFVMVGLRLTQVDETNFEKLVNQVQEQANQAAAVPSGNAVRAKALWLAVIQRVDEAEQVHPGDPTLRQIRAQAQTILDGYASVTRRQTTPLRSFNANAKLGTVVIQGSTDLYTLDRSQSGIYRDTLRQPDLIGARGSQPIVQAGLAVSQYSVKHIVNMIWMSEGGIRDSHGLVALDTQGILVTYSPTFAPATAQALQGSDGWVSPVAIQTYQNRLYILDPGANQIWRYLPDGTTYPSAPELYFAPIYQRQLANAVDFAIDVKGNVIVLFADGSIKEYNGGAEQLFDFSDLPDGHLKSANAMYLDATSALPALYVLDPVDQSVYEFTLSGKFQARFRSTDPNAFAKLSGIYVDGSNVYVTSGQMLYYFTTSSAAPATATP